MTGNNQAGELQNSVSFREAWPILSVLQSPHHGSESGLTKDIVALLHPKLGVISVSAHNLYHHPNPFTLSLFKEENIPIKRNDKNGEIDIVTDGRTIN